MYYLTFDDGKIMEFERLIQVIKLTGLSNTFINRKLKGKDGNFVYNNCFARLTEGSPKAPSPSGYVAFKGDVVYRGNFFNELGEKLDLPQNTVAYAYHSDVLTKTGWRIWDAESFMLLKSEEQESTEPPEKKPRKGSAFDRDFRSTWKGSPRVLSPQMVQSTVGRGYEPHIRPREYL